MQTTTREESLTSTETSAKVATEKRLVPVLFLINGEFYSGAERVQDILATELPSLGFQVGFACVKPGIFPGLRRAADSPLYETPMQGRFDLRTAWRVARLVRRDKYRIIHAHTPRTCMIGRLVAVLTGVPLVYHVHSPTLRDSTHGIRNRINSYVERMSLVGAKELIAVSESLGRWLLKCGYSPKKINVVPNGVPSPELIRKSTPPGPEWTLGMTALFRPRKGLEILLESLAAMRRAQLPVKLLAVGPFETPEYETHIMDIVRRLDLADVIEWTGFTDDVAAQLRRMDLFVLPSLFGEGLPMVILEAMATGVPVVATRVEGAPEAIRDGEDGALADPNDVESLVDAITRIVTGKRDWTTLRENALARHAQRFSARSMAAGVARVYEKIL